MGRISEESARGYISEIIRKYPDGATISNVPSKKDLAGKRLRGDYYLEVPEQRARIPPSLLDYAREKNVRIRDVAGRDY